jgi:hypothetical protein
MTFDGHAKKGRTPAIRVLRMPRTEGFARFRPKGQSRRITLSPLIHSTLSLPNGARFYRCAFQVNPYEYLIRHDKKPSQPDEAAYNREMVNSTGTLRR